MVAMLAEIQYKERTEQRVFFALRSNPNSDSESHCLSNRAWPLALEFCSASEIITGGVRTHPCSMSNIINLRCIGRHR